MDDRQRQEAEALVAKVDRRLAALQDLGVNTATLQSQLQFARDLTAEGRSNDATQLCEDVLALAERMAKGHGDPEPPRPGRGLPPEQVAREVRKVLENGMLAKTVSELMTQQPESFGKSLTTRISQALGGQIQGLREELQAQLQHLSPGTPDLQQLEAPLLQRISGIEGHLDQVLGTLADRLDRLSSSLMSPAVQSAQPAPETPLPTAVPAPPPEPLAAAASEEKPSTVDEKAHTVVLDDAHVLDSTANPLASGASRSSEDTWALMGAQVKAASSVAPPEPPPPAAVAPAPPPSPTPIASPADPRPTKNEALALAHDLDRLLADLLPDDGSDTHALAAQEAQPSAPPPAPPDPPPSPIVAAAVAAPQLTCDQATLRGMIEEIISARLAAVPVAQPVSSPQKTSAALWDGDHFRRELKGFLPELLRDPEIKQHLFAVLAVETVVQPGALAELSGLRRFVMSEVERLLSERRPAGSSEGRR